MPKDTAILGQYRRALAGTASVLASASAPAVAIAGAGAPAGIACDVCGLNLPRSASHVDVTAHPCYRGFSISLSAAGHIVLA